MPLQQWSMPDSYFGFNPVGDYGVYSRHRDSDTLTNSNWECLLKFFKGIEQAYPFEPTQDDKYKEHWDGTSTAPGSWVYTWTASHWAVGWVEYMMLSEDAPDKLREIAEETMDDLKRCYPVFDDDHYSNLCWENKCKYWEDMSIKERVYYCQKANVSIFAARRDELPYDVEEYIED